MVSQLAVTRVRAFLGHSIAMAKSQWPVASDQWLVLQWTVDSAHWVESGFLGIIVFEVVRWDGGGDEA